MDMARADAASLSFILDPEKDHYIYEFCIGRMNLSFIKSHLPCLEELVGRQAIKEKRPKLIPEPSVGHDEEELAKFNESIFKEEVKAMAVFPLIVGEKEGILYLYFREPHWFANDGIDEEIDELQAFVGRAVDGIRDVDTTLQGADRDRKQAAVRRVAQWVEEELPKDADLLREIGWSTLNTLDADIVTIYEYIETEQKFITPPTIAGQLRSKQYISKQVRDEDVPVKIIEGRRNVYIEQSNCDRILNPDRSAEEGLSFVERERIESSAGILLKVGQETVGVMFVNYRRHHGFSNEEKNLIDILASSAAIAIKRRRSW
jgi:hypothetical protein